MSSTRLRWAAFATACLVYLGTAIFGVRSARAYPQYQFSSGAVRCNQCHVDPAGGGLLTGYGRDQNGEELSTFEGEGAFLHGAVDLPSWLALMVNLRGAFVAKDSGNPEGAERAVFPMQADLAGRVAFSDAWSFTASVGARGQVRDNDEEAYYGAGTPAPLSQSRVISREHYLMWRPNPTGVYVRAGRFYAPFGLRLAEHTTYIRRDLGFNLLQETYNLSGGWVYDQWELHVTAFAPDFWRHGSRDAGGAAYLERRLGESFALAVQGKASTSSEIKHGVTGLVGKAYVAPIKTMLMAEANLDFQRFSTDAAGSTRQFVGLAGLTVFPLKGVLVSAFAERKQTSIQVKDTATNAVDGILQWFPYPHFEIYFLGQIEMPTGQQNVKTFLAQLHYWL